MFRKQLSQELSYGSKEVKKIIEDKDFFVCVDSNVQEKVTSENIENSCVRFQWFYEWIQSFQEDIQQILSIVKTAMSKIKEDYDFIMEQLKNEKILLKLHSENRIFCEKYLKRYDRIFEALNKMIPECNQFYEKDSKMNINSNASRAKIVSILDDVLPFILVQLHKARDKLERNVEQRRKKSEEIFEQVKKRIKRNSIDQIQFSKNRQTQFSNEKPLFDQSSHSNSETDINSIFLHQHSYQNDKHFNEEINLRRQKSDFDYEGISYGHLQEELTDNILDIKNSIQSFQLFTRMWRNIAQAQKFPSLRVISDGIKLDMGIVRSNLQEFCEIRKLNHQRSFMVSSLNDSQSLLFAKLPLTCVSLANSIDFISILENIKQIYNLDDNAKLFCFDEDYLQVNYLEEPTRIKLIKIYTPQAEICHKQEQLLYQQQQLNILTQSKKKDLAMISDILLLNHQQIDQYELLQPQQQVEQHQAIVIGISGSTRSGKGTLCTHLQILYGAKHICQDSYFDYQAIIKLDGNAECKEAIDWNTFILDIQQAVHSLNNSIVLLEGFQLFNDERVSKMCDVKIFLDISEHDIYERRMSTKPVKESYFWKFLIKEYSKYRKQCVNDPNIKVLKSSDVDQLQLFFISAQFIEEVLNAS